MPLPSRIELTTLQMVKDVLRPESSLAAAVDTQINALISTVSRRMETEMQRWVKKASYTEQLDVLVDQTIFCVQAAPIASSPAMVIKNDTERAFGSGTTVDANNYYAPDDDTGLIHFNPDVLVSGRGALQIVYTGGMAEGTDEFVTNYPDLAHAAALEVVNHLNSVKNLGVSLRQIPGAENVIYKTLDFLPGTKTLLQQYRRMVY